MRSDDPILHPDLIRAPEPDVLGIVTEARERRNTFEKFVERRVTQIIESNAFRLQVTRLVDQKLQEEVDAIVARRTRESVKEIEALRPADGPTVLGILNAVAGVTGFTCAELTGPRRARRVARARQLAYHLLRVLRPDLSLPMIGRAIGNRDHTSIMHGLRVVASHREAQPLKAWLAHPAIAKLMEKGSAPS